MNGPISMPFQKALPFHSLCYQMIEPKPRLMMFDYAAAMLMVVGTVAYSHLISSGTFGVCTIIGFHDSRDC